MTEQERERRRADMRSIRLSDGRRRAKYAREFADDAREWNATQRWFGLRRVSPPTSVAWHLLLISLSPAERHAASMDE